MNCITYLGAPTCFSMWRFQMHQALYALIWFYQKAISLDHSLWRKLRKGPTCKFYPTCSEYARDALEKQGIIRGTALIAHRLLRCNPWSKGGIDQP